MWFGKVESTIATVASNAGGIMEREQYEGDDSVTENCDADGLKSVMVTIQDIHLNHANQNGQHVAAENSRDRTATDSGYLLISEVKRT